MLLLINNTGHSVEKLKQIIITGGIDQRLIIEKKAHENWRQLPDINEIVILMHQQTDETNRKLIHLCKQAYPSTPLIIIAEDYKQSEEQQREHEYNGLYLSLDDITPNTIKLILRCATDMQTEYVQMGDFRRMFRENPVPMFIYDSETLRFLDANNIALKKYKYTYEEFKQLTIIDIRPEEDIPKLQNVLPEQNKDGYHDFGIWRHRKKDQTDFYVHIMTYKTQHYGKDAQVVIAYDVDKYVRAERNNKLLNTKLEENKKHVNDILASVNEMIWSRDATDYKITYVNSACENIYGYKPEEMINTKGSLENDMIHPDDRKIVEGQIKKLMISGHADAEYRIRDRHGNTKHVMTKAVLTRKADGTPDIVTGATTDITELKEARIQLNEKSLELEHVMDAITDGFVLIDKDWKFTYVNRAFENMYEITSEEVIGLSYWDFFPLAKDQKFFTEYHRAIKEQKTVQFEEYSSFLDKWLSVNIYPVEKGISIYFTDITETHKLQRKIRENELNLEVLINNTEDIIWSIDTDMKLIYANDSFIKGIQAYANISPKPGDYILYDTMPGNIEKYKECYQRALNGISCAMLDKVDANNEINFFETKFYPVQNDDGSISGVTAYMKNVTERFKYIRTIEEQNQRLHKIAWLQSHKVRSEVARILGLIHVLDIEDYSTATNKKILEDIREVSLELDKVIHEIDKQAKLVELT